MPPGYTDGTRYTSTITHDLGYIPAILAYVQSTSGAVGGADGSNLPLIITSGEGVSPYALLGLVDCSVNASTAIFAMTGASGFALNGVWTIKYYLLRETAS